MKLTLYTFYRRSWVFASKTFQSGSFLLQYPGELITEAEADEREKEYARSSKGCYMYFFEHERRTMWEENYTYDNLPFKLIN